MPAMRDDVLASLLDTYESNLLFLKKNFPVLYAKVQKCDLDALPFSVNEHGEVSISVGKHYGKAEDYQAFHDDLYRRFDHKDSRKQLVVTTPHFSDLWSIAPQAFSGDFEYLIEPKFRKLIIDKFKEAGGDLVLDKPNFGDRTFPLLFVFGTGYGSHLQRLAEEYEVDNLVIMETDIENFILSLFFVDYFDIYELFFQKERRIFIACEEDIDVLAQGVLAAVGEMCPPFFIQGAGLMLQMDDTEAQSALWENLKKRFLDLYRGWGYLDDEILGIQHALDNYKKKVPMLLGGYNKLQGDLPVFIVGNGPSLDALIPVVRENLSKVILFSCGSSLSALAKNGIQPDFHVEIERTAITARLLSLDGTRELLKNTPLIGSVIMDPNVYGMTSCPLMFSKFLDSGSNLLDPEFKNPRLHSNPTCTNGGLALALELGFKEIYLIGVDLGYEDPEHHHSKSSFYYAGEAQTQELQNIRIGEQGKYINNGDEQRLVPGNFLDVVLSNRQFIFARDVMELAISAYSDVRLFNLNRGARIRGAEPLDPNSIEIATVSSIRKKETVEHLKTIFHKPDLDFSSELVSSYLEGVDKVINYLSDMDDCLYSTKLDIVKIFDDFYFFLTSPDMQKKPSYPLILGGATHICRFAFDAVSHLPNDSMACQYMSEALIIIHDFFVAVKRFVFEYIQSGSVPEFLAKKR